MTSVKVAVRVRPFNQRPEEQSSSCIIEMVDNQTTIINPVSLESLKREFLKEENKSRLGLVDILFNILFKLSSMLISSVENWREERVCFRLQLLESRRFRNGQRVRNCGWRLQICRSGQGLSGSGRYSFYRDSSNFD